MKNTRLILVSVVYLICIHTGFSQVTKSDYFMSTSYHRNNLNPALRPEQGYLVVPLLPSLGGSIQTNRFNLDHLTFEGPAGKRVTFMHQSVDAEHFLSNLSDDNYLSTDMNMKFFGLGFYVKDSFWNIDFGIRIHADVNIPKPFFGLLKKGFDQDSQSTYDLSELSATGYSFAELGISHSRLFFDKNLTVGARIKFLGGLADFDLHAKSLNIQAGPDFWQAKSEVSLKASAPGVKAKYDSDENFDGFDFGDFGMPGYGIGFDIGAAYNLGHIYPSLNGLKVSTAFNDIGFISWSKKNTVILHSPETEVRITPSDYSFSKEDDLSLSDVLDDAFTDIKEAVNLKQDGPAAGRTSMLRMNMNAGVEYEIFKRRLSVGALYSARFGNYFTASEFTFSANARLCSWLAAGVSYSFMHSKFDTFGFALHLAPSKGLNLFFASDYSIPHISSDFYPTTCMAFNFQTGISIPLGKRR